MLSPWNQIICKEFELTIVSNTSCSSLALTAVIEAVVPLGSRYGSTLVFDKGGGIDRGELELGERDKWQWVKEARLEQVLQRLGQSWVYTPLNKMYKFTKLLSLI